LVLVSPIIGALRGTRHRLEEIVEKVDSERIHTYVITCPPAEDDTYHAEAIQMLWRSPLIEIRYNCSLHAKVTEPDIGAPVARAVQVKPASSITLRSVAVGALSIVVLSLANPSLYWVLHTWDVGSGMLMPGMVLMLFLLVALNTLLVRLLPGRAFSRTELLVVYGMLAISLGLVMPDFGDACVP
jgi:hypothetical protein